LDFEGITVTVEFETVYQRLFMDRIVCNAPVRRSMAFNVDESEKVKWRGGANLTIYGPVFPIQSYKLNYLPGLPEQQSYN
jgi:hypothetical protein